MGGTTMLDSTALEAARARNTAHKAMTARSIPQRYLRRRASTGPGWEEQCRGQRTRDVSDRDFARLTGPQSWAACQIGTTRPAGVPRGLRWLVPRSPEQRDP